MEMTIEGGRMGKEGGGREGRREEEIA